MLKITKFFLMNILISFVYSSLVKASSDDMCKESLFGHVDISSLKGHPSKSKQIPLTHDPKHRRYFATDLSSKLGATADFAHLGSFWCRYPAGTKIKFCDNRKPQPNCFTEYRDLTSPRGNDVGFFTYTNKEIGMQSIETVEIITPYSKNTCVQDQFRICFYEAPNLKGTSFCYTKPHGDVDKPVDEFDEYVENKASSVRVGSESRTDGTLEICADKYFGTCNTIKPENYNDFYKVGLAKIMKSFHFICEQ